MVDFAAILARTGARTGAHVETATGSWQGGMPSETRGIRPRQDVA
jgi:hypothetical protein